MTQPLTLNCVVKAQLWTVDVEQASVNTWHYQIVDLTGTPVLLEEFATKFLGVIIPLYAPMISANADIVGGVFQVVQPLPLRVAVKSISGAQSGTAEMPAMPRQTAGLISWKTTLAGPGGRGRTYIPFPGVAATEGLGVPTDAYVTSMTDLATALFSLPVITGAAGGTATAKIGLKRQTPAEFVQFTAAVPNKKWATQKRRGSYGRPNFSPLA
jgi:hypothetical protein